MKSIQTTGKNNGFNVLASTKRSQAAMMVIKPGDCEGGPDNKHEGADQWLFVLSGVGEATVSKKKRKLSAGTLLLIEAGEPHEIKNTGKSPLRTVNFYAPPEY